ncbi:MAG TPA: EAL domain-containing protein [Gammaproteobacteria bacterium]|nr:EAL domain-containing protein [Gammaproteobacteria bacterium]
MEQPLAIVDDESELGHLLCEMVSREGFLPLYFKHGGAFVEYYRNNPELKLVILDLIMPEKDGIEVLRSLAELNADLGIILVSGCDDSILHAAHRLARESSLNVLSSLHKPIRAAELRQVLSSPTAREIMNKEVSDASADFSRRELFQAIHDNELILHYQPKLEISNRKLVGFEALVRWQHPSAGLVPPDHFIPLAERYDIIDQLTDWVLRQVLLQLTGCQVDGRRLCVAINLSVKTLTDLSLPESLSQLVRDRFLDPSCIVLEITESALMERVTTVLDILTRLRMKGFSLSIDDFGTGYSSLVQLHRIPFTELKIDRSFIGVMKDDVEARAIVESCILLGKKMGMRIVAEGVEDQVTWEMLEQMGCDVAQGFLIARPMPYEQMMEWLQRYANEPGFLPS